MIGFSVSRRAFSTGLLASAILPSGLAHARPRAAQRGFRMFNATLYTDQPDLRPLGIYPIHVIDRGIWRDGEGRTSLPSRSKVAELVRSLPRDGAPIVMDFEEFHLNRGAEERAFGLGRLNAIAAAFRAAAPDREIGFYGYLPQRDYWRAIQNPRSTAYKAWQEENSAVAPLARQIDLLFPSVYTFYPDVKGWELYAEAQIREARRLSDKPVYVFLWPDYHHGGSMAPSLPLPPAFWRRQLELARELADGVVIWGGWDFARNKRKAWDPEEAWWRETRLFLGPRE
ncbi:MAG: hypothetical protein ACO1OD_05220 [Croceibacterium sp.]